MAKVNFASMNRNQHINKFDATRDLRDNDLNGYWKFERAGFAPRGQFISGKSSKSRKVCTVKGF